MHTTNSRLARTGLKYFKKTHASPNSPRHPQKATPRPQPTLICERCGKLIESGTPHAESPRLLHLECLSQELP